MKLVQVFSRRNQLFYCVAQFSEGVCEIRGLICHSVSTMCHCLLKVLSVRRCFMTEALQRLMSVI